MPVRFLLFCVLGFKVLFAAAEVRTVSPAYDPGEPIEVTFANLPGNDTDWITLVSSSALDSQFGEWFYVRGMRAGRYVFRGKPVGQYEVREYHNWPVGQYVVRHRAKVDVRNEGDSRQKLSTPLVWTTKEVYRTGEPVEIIYEGLSGMTNDWITLIERNRPVQQYGQWFYTNGKRSGRFTFKGAAAGSYEVRLYLDWPSAGYKVVGRHSVSIVGHAANTVVGARASGETAQNSSTIGVASSTPGSGSGNSGIASVGAPNQIGRWSYVKPAGAIPPIANLWGYDESRPQGSRLFPGSTSYFQPIDTMIFVVDGRNVELHSFPNVDVNGERGISGDFQCTALVASYLSLLGVPRESIAVSNGKDAVTDLMKSHKQLFTHGDRSVPPRAGSIVSMVAGSGGHDDGVGHVAIVKGVEAIDDVLVVNLLEQNIHRSGSNEFAVNRTIEFRKDSSGLWSASHSISKGGPKYPVINWITPNSLQ